MACFALSPSQRWEAPFRALPRGEGTNSVRLFTPGKKKSLTKSKVPGVWPPWLTNQGWSFLISRIRRTIRSSEHLRHPKKRELRRNDCHKTLEERLILGKYREAPRIDYGVKQKASLLIMQIYTCVLMLYKGQRSRTHPVYSLFKFQSKFMFCKCKTVFLLMYFKILTNFTCKRIRAK